jgi:hypothetical protein
MSQHAIIRNLAGAALTVAAVGVLGWSPARAPSKIGGTFALKYAEQHPLPVPDAAGHVLLVGRVEGSNRSTGPVAYMDQAQVTNLEFADLTQGNGPQQGYITMRSGADTVISRWSGKVTTTLSPDKTPLTRFEGTWTKVKGTGQYQGITGSGIYKGRFTSQTEYTVDWKGEISGAPLAEK